MKLSSSFSSSSLTGLGGRVGHLSLGRELGLRRCKKKELGKVLRELGCGADGRGVAKSGRAGLGFLEFI